MNRRRIVPLLTLLILAAAALWTRGFGLLGDGREDGGLTLYGNVDIREVDMAFRTGGRINEIPVEEGDDVAEGALLAVLDAGPIESRVSDADARIAEARAHLAMLRSGNRPQEIAQAQAHRASAAAQLTMARADYNRREGLAEAGALSGEAWDRTKAELARAEAGMAQASAALSLASEGARAEDIAAAEARLRSAEAARSGTGTELGDTRLMAASAGTIVTRAAEPGSLVQAGQTVMTLSINRPMRVRAYIGEPALPRISPGMAVNVHVDGNDKTYSGTIGHISPRAEFTPKSVETESLRIDLVYRLRIIVSDPDDGLRQGQPVTITVPAARPAAGN